MTAVASSPARTRGGSFLAAFRLGFATVATKGRMIFSVVGVLFFVALALILRSSADLSKDEAAGIAFGAYFLLLLPLIAVSNASLAFGNAVQDSTLVYFWLRPIARWKLALAFVAATVASLLPMVLAFSLGLFVLGASPRMVLAAVVASLLAAFAYSGPVVALGVKFKRAAMMALTYVILGETILGGLRAVGRISVRNYAGAVFEDMSTEDLGLGYDPGLPVSVVVLLLIGALGIGLATWFLQKADVA